MWVLLIIENNRTFEQLVFVVFGHTFAVFLGYTQILFNKPIFQGRQHYEMYSCKNKKKVNKRLKKNLM